ncbi:MAG: hypothetical protein GC157_14420 [Frankiales bacterium]|nr:hypothetical protein [Frankiales bacterium]
MSRAFKVGCDDDQEYWIKTLEGVDPSQRASLVLEQVVGRVGLLLGVAVVPPHLVRIPVGMDFPELGNGRAVLPGVAHASVSFSSVVEKKAVPDHRGDDDNKRRHAGIFALADLARGSDPQYLYDTSADNSIFSHDHGLYACNTGQLDVQAMVASVDQPGMSCGDPVGLDTAELERLADRLGSIAESEIAPILNLVPSDWPVSDEQLGTLGWFLFERAANVAVRLRGLMP